MKKIFFVITALLLVFFLVGCGETSDSNEHVGEAKSPSGSSIQKGEDFLKVVEDFKKHGFTNIRTEKLDDLITGWLTKDGEVESVTIDGNVDYSPDDWYPNDVEVLITYHTFPDDNENTESPSTGSEGQEQPSNDKNETELTAALEVKFPVVNAKRSAVVALTNYFATDVFSEDGNTYDSSKFHKYSDTSGNFYNYYLAVDSWGDWTSKNGEDWVVDNLVVVNSYGMEINASLDVSYDGSNYVIKNIKGTLGDSVDLSEIETAQNASQFLVITNEQIQDDRNHDRLDSHHSWVISQFSSWDGSHKMLKDLIIESLNDEKSFDHIETTYQEVFADDIKNNINEILISANVDIQVEIGDLWIMTQFSSKNSFNAVVKNTAYGVSSFKDNKVTLVGIE